MAALLWTCCWIFGGGPDDGFGLRRYEFEATHMATNVRVAFYARDEAAASVARQAVFRRIAALDAELSDYREDSGLSRLSASAGSGRACPAGPDLIAVLSRSLEIAALSKGAFDPTAGAVVRLWRKTRRSRELPETAELEAAVATVGPAHLRLDAPAGTATLDAAGTLLDLGGIAKGFAADEGLRVLAGLGITRAMVAAGGDIACGAAPPLERGWRVGIAPADAPDAAAGRTLVLCHAACSTSGDAYQHVDIAGRRYGHIVDPRTGAALPRRGSVTVVANDATTTDALATAAFVLGPRETIALIESLPGVEASFTDLEEAPPRTRDSRGFDRHVLR